MQNDGEDDEQPIDVGLRIQRFIGLGAKLDYGCIVYGAASNNILKKLDPIHHQGLRIALGAFRTSPVTSLYAKAQEMSLKKQTQETVNELCFKTKNLS